MHWNKRLSDLQFHLAELFPLKEDILPLAGKVGISISSLAISDKGIIMWYNVLTEARRKGLMDELVSEARRLFPEDKLLNAFNAEMAEQGNEAGKQLLKELCLDLLQEDQVRNAIPIVEQLIEQDDVDAGREEEIVIRYATVYRHKNISQEASGRRKRRANRYLQKAKSNLVAILMVL